MAISVVRGAEVPVRIRVCRLACSTSFSLGSKRTRTHLQPPAAARPPMVRQGRTAEARAPRREGVCRLACWLACCWSSSVHWACGQQQHSLVHAQGRQAAAPVAGQLQAVVSVGLGKEAGGASTGGRGQGQERQPTRTRWRGCGLHCGRCGCCLCWAGKAAGWHRLAAEAEAVARGALQL